MGRTPSSLSLGKQVGRGGVSGIVRAWRAKYGWTPLPRTADRIDSSRCGMNIDPAEPPISLWHSQRRTLDARVAADRFGACCDGYGPGPAPRPRADVAPGDVLRPAPRR